MRTIIIYHPRSVHANNIRYDESLLRLGQQKWTIWSNNLTKIIWEKFDQTEYQYFYATVYNQECEF